MRGINRHLAALALTPEVEMFCQEIVAHGVQRRAYLKAYPHATAWRSAKQSQYGRRLRNVPEVAARIAKLRADGTASSTDVRAPSPVAPSTVADPRFHAELANNPAVAVDVRVAAFGQLLLMVSGAHVEVEMP